MSVTIQTPEQIAKDYLFRWMPQLLGTIAERELVNLIKGNVEVQDGQI